VIVTPGAVARLALIVIFTVALQVSGVQGVNILGGNADLIPLVVAAVALWGGCIPGAAIGFACGLLLDLVLGQDVGSSSLVLTALGFWVGRYGEVNEPSNALLPIPVGAAATGGAGCCCAQPAVASAAAAWIHDWVVYYGAFDPVVQVIRGVAMAVSAIVFVAGGSVALHRALRRAGVLEGFPD